MNTTALSWLFFTQLVYVVVAWIFYAIDRTRGKDLYRWCYNLTHEDVLSQETIRGFICGRTGKVQVRAALVLSILVTLCMAFFVQKGAVIWFFTGTLGFLTTIVGFILGPVIAKLWAKRETVYSAIDTMEAGETPEIVKEAKRSLISRFASLWPKRQRPPRADDPDVREPAVEPEVQEPVSVSGANPQSQDELSWEEKIGRFTGGGKKDGE